MAAWKQSHPPRQLARRYSELTGEDVDGAKEVAERVQAGDPAALAVWPMPCRRPCDRHRLDRRRYFAAGSSCWWWHGQRWRTPAGPLREQLAIKLNILRAPELVQAQLGDEAGCLGSRVVGLGGIRHLGHEPTGKLGMTTYTCAHALTPDGLVHDVTIEVDDRLITSVTSGEPAAAGAIELGDVTVVPGFIDMHVHGVGLSFSEGPEAATSAARFHLGHGTTSLLASLASAPLDELGNANGRAATAG